jgi:hypothetical protein
MLRLFRRKMVSVVKYFRRNQFQKKLFSRKYFSAFGSHEKITKSENATIAGIRQRPVTVAGIRRACLAESGQNCRIPVLPIFERPTIVGFGQSDIKRACKDE